MRRPLLRLTTLCAVATVATLAHAATFPADGDWIPLEQQGVGMGDPDTDGQGNGREIVGSEADPAVFIYVDATDFFVRLRIDTDPMQGGNLRPYGWGLLLDTDGNLLDFEYSLMVNGIANPDQIELAENTDKTGVGDPSDEAELELAVYPWDDTPGGNGRVLPAATTFGGTPDFFLDFAVPIADLTAAGISLSDPLVFWAGTSSNARSITVDLAGTESQPGPGMLDDSASDPIIVGDQPIDVDGDGLTGEQEIAGGTDPFDADSDDDGVPDGDEPSWNVDSDGDGLVNALDPDSDNDGLFDGTELGLDCSGLATDPEAGTCVPDGDGGATTTDPLVADTDGGGVTDGNEDWDLDGVVDGGETDPTDGHGADDGTITDTDGDGLSDDVEDTLGSDPADGDSDDDGVPDGLEPNPSQDVDGDGVPNIMDEDSDGDGLFDGTELGRDCDDPATDLAANHCIADGDEGATTTNPLLFDTDDGGLGDGEEDTDFDGVIDEGERDPNNPADDGWCVTDGDCGAIDSGMVCDTENNHFCIEGCRGTDGNGCPADELCSSEDATIGVCIPTGTGGGGTGGGGTGGSGTGGAGATGGSGPGTGGGQATPAGGVWAEGAGFCSAPAGRPGTQYGAWLVGLAALAWLARARQRNRRD